MKHRIGPFVSGVLWVLLLLLFHYLRRKTALSKKNVGQLLNCILFHIWLANQLFYELMLQRKDLNLVLVKILIMKLHLGG